MRRVQTLDFALIETGLFLDSHPDDQAAMEYYHRLRDARTQAVSAYEEAFGPLTQMGVEGDRWSWVDSPWPWEMED